ncbi:MAG: DUF1549 domain-containing protein [Bacteroidia bacterium]|nr:DUF1549 domain-containing protein [Bacteroidia bacterium]
MMIPLDALWFLTFLGRLHPMVVHFPIALLIVALLMEMMTLRGKNENFRGAITLLLRLGAVSAIVSVALGLILHEQESYGGELIEYHEWSGIATMLFSLLAVWLNYRSNKRSTGVNLYRIVLGLSVICLTIAGHLGASLTHGEDYLSSTFPGNGDSHEEGKAGELLAEFASQSPTGSFSPEDLDRLNLEVRAIFAHNCYQCHSKEKSKGDLVLQTKEGVMAGGENGPVLVAGNADQSEMIRRLLLPRSDDESMPPKGKTLQKNEIELIRLWINQGAHWADKELKIFREAELALTKPELPPAEDGRENPVDRWVNQYFQENNQDWPETADDRTFIRRAYLDVVGLLPAPEQITAFTEDNSPDKRAKLVDQLLSDSTGYTRHWLTFWNDLLRNDYSGTGFITGGRTQITNWLYHSLYDNKPYDQMVRELIAPNPESEGFIRGIRWRGTVNSSQRTEMQAAQNISQSLLGLNLKCASCHDSFISNITLDQSYAFANVFADTALEIHRCDKPTGRMAQTGFIYPELGEVEANTVKERLVRLSEIMVKPENGRLARTLVNRLWAKLMGRGIVAPVDEMDRIPWSQELLDWLAADFRDHGYDLKHNLRTIMTSKIYQSVPTGYKSENDLIVSDYRFRGPVQRRLSAEQFADVFSQAIYPMYHAVAYDPEGDTLEAKWIWHREIKLDRDVLPEPGKRYFRYLFEIPANKEIVNAELLVTADHSFHLHLNEKEITSGDDWQEVHKADLTGKVAAGKNIIAAEAENEGPIANPAGLLVSIQIEYADGSWVRFYSNNQWKTTDTEPKGNWRTLLFDDKEWKNARNYGDFFNGKWGRLPAFTHKKQANPQPPVRASLVMLDPFMKALGRPTRENVTTNRDDQASLLQALELTNGEFFYQTLRKSASYWLKISEGNAQQLQEQVFLRALGREPTGKEKAVARKLLTDSPTAENVEDFLWNIVMLPEFQLIL